MTKHVRCTTFYEEANILAGLSDKEFVDAVNNFLMVGKEAYNSYGIKSIVVSVIKDSRASFPIRFGEASQYVRQSVALVGGAAHVNYSLAGKDINMCFRNLTNQYQKALLLEI